MFIVLTKAVSSIFWKVGGARVGDKTKPDSPSSRDDSSKRVLISIHKHKPKLDNLCVFVVNEIVFWYKTEHDLVEIIDVGTECARFLGARTQSLC